MRKELLAIFFFLIFCAQIASAQVNIGERILSMVYPYIGIIFIIIFVIILLIIGGVWRPSLGGGIFPTLVFIILIIILFVVPQYVTFPDYMKTVPQSFKYWELPGPAKDALQLIGLPREWGYIPALIYLFILPFTAVFALFWAFLDTLGIIPQANVKRILALIVAFMTIPMGFFVKMVWVLFSFMGIWSVVVFAAIFILGLFFRGAGVVGKEYAEYRKLANVRRARLKDAVKKLEAAKGDPKEIPSIIHEYADVLPANAVALISEGLNKKDSSVIQEGINAAKKAL